MTLLKKILLRARTSVLVFLTHRIALPLLKRIRKPVNFQYTLTDLKEFPKGSLGHDLWLFLDKRQLPLLRHYARHDLKHMLLGYDTTDEGEACLQSFMLGNGRKSIPVLATVSYSSLTMPEHWKKIKQAYKDGKASQPVHNLVWSKIVHEQTINLRQQFITKGQNFFTHSL